MPLPPAFLDELRARTPLPALVGRRARLVRNGRQWKGCCPFHNEKTPSFYVYDDHFHCFGCGAHGDAITFLMRAEGASFPEAVERLAAEAGLEVPKPSPQAAAKERRARDLHGVLAAAEAAYRRRLFLPEGRPALDYLRRRGLSDETIARFGLGWSGEGRGALAAELKAEGIEPAQLVAAGLMKPRDPERPEAGLSDMFFGRVMFPIRDRRGRTISFGGRILGDGQPKYVNGPETELFRKRQGLYGLDLAREGTFKGATLLVVEGYMDVIALHQAGFAGAVAPLGTALTQEQLELIWQLSSEPVLCFDGDKAGMNAVLRSAENVLPQLSSDRRVKVILLPQGEDPDTFIAKQGPHTLRNLLARGGDFVNFLFRISTESITLSTPEAVSGWQKRHDEWLNQIKDVTTRRAYAEFFRGARFEHLKALRAAKPREVTRGHRAPRQPGDEFRHLRSTRAPVPRPPVESHTIRLERARNLLAILLRHPHLLPGLEEPLMVLDLPPGDCQALRTAMLAWVASAERLDSDALVGHLAEHGMGSAVSWATRAKGLCREAAAQAQPKEALDGWWHFFGLLRGEAELIADLSQAQHVLAETNDPVAQQRLIRLTEALAALRSGEVETVPEEEPPRGSEASRAGTIG